MINDMTEVGQFGFIQRGSPTFFHNSTWLLIANELLSVALRGSMRKDDIKTYATMSQIMKELSVNLN